MNFTMHVNIIYVRQAIFYTGTKVNETQVTNIEDSDIKLQQLIKNIIYDESMYISIKPKLGIKLLSNIRIYQNLQCFLFLYLLEQYKRWIPGYSLFKLLIILLVH